MIKVFLGMIMGAGLFFGTTAYLDKRDPTPRAAVYLNICPTKQLGVLWFMSNNEPKMEWITTQEAADKAGETARKLPKDSKGTLIVPCPRPRVE